MDELFSVGEIRVYYANSRFGKVKRGKSLKKSGEVESIKSFRKINKTKKGDFIGFHGFNVSVTNEEKCSGSAVTFAAARQSW